MEKNNIMERSELFNLISKKLALLSKIPLADMEDPKKYGRGKTAYFCGNRRGLYFLFDKTDNMIYVGKIGNGKRTSLYSRMKGHGNGAHAKQSWYEEIDYGYYLNLPNLTVDEIEKLERICIQFNKNRNNYNDKYITASDVDIIFKKLQ